MKFVSPDCLKEFVCAGGACKHTCCAHWEIDIDEETRARYHALSEPLRSFIESGIDDAEDGTHFRMKAGERCFFLRDDGLCELIVREGPDILCQICADHPRFRNFFSDREETGLGLCCEEAGRLILTREAPMTFLIEDDGDDDGEPLTEEEEALLTLREQLISLMQNREKTVDERLDEMLTLCAPGSRLPAIREFAAFLKPLETLDPEWTRRMETLEKAEDPLTLHDIGTPMEQFAVYLLWRQLPEALIDGDIEDRVRRIVMTCRLLATLDATYPGQLIENARLYSSEIEYSDVNGDLILDYLYEYNRVGEEKE